MRISELILCRQLLNQPVKSIHKVKRMFLNSLITKGWFTLYDFFIRLLQRANRKCADLFHKWRPINYSFIPMKISLTNLVSVCNIQ